MAEKRTFGVLSDRIGGEEVRAACTLSAIAQLYAALLHCVVAGSDLMLTDTASKRGYAPILFTMSDTDLLEHPFLGTSMNKGA